MWFTQKQMAELFGKDRRTITRHIQNIYKDEELSSFFEHTAEEGIEPNNFMFARNLAGKKAVFLIQKGAIIMIFSVLAFIAVIVSICIKDRKKSLCVQSINCICEAIYDFIVSAFTGAVLSIINFIRTCLFINKDKFSKKIYLLILIIFESVIAINCVFTWNGLISLLPTIGSMIRAYCLWQSNMKLVRISGITTGILYGSYYIYYQGWFMVLGYTILLIVGIYTFYKNDIKKKNEE